MIRRLFVNPILVRVDLDYRIMSTGLTQILYLWGGLLFANAPTTLLLIDLLRKSWKGEAFADKNIDFSHKSGRKCFTPTPNYRLLQEV